jgi:hypothetical protein
MGSTAAIKGTRRSMMAEHQEQVSQADGSLSTAHLDDLRAQAQHARQRYDLYKARAYGQRPTSPTRMREFQRASEQAETRLHAAEAEWRSAHPSDGGPPV